MRGFASPFLPPRVSRAHVGCGIHRCDAAGTRGPGGGAGARAIEGAAAEAFRIEKAAAGVYAAVANGRALINCNAAIFERERDLLIVDAHSQPSAVYSLVAQIRREVTEKPVRYVVATHLHGDHTQGLPAYRKISPGANIIASATTRRLLVEVGPQRLKSALDAIPASIASIKDSRLQKRPTPAHITRK